MSLSSNRAAYADCFALLEQALASPRGIIVKCVSFSEAHYLRNRLNRARQVDCEANKRAYQPGDFLYNNSEFYALVTKVVGNEGIWQVRIEKPKVSPMAIEEIPEEEGNTEILDVAQFGRVLHEREKPDDFGLPEEDMEPSPPGKDGARRF